MASVTFTASVGGDGSTVTDDNNASTGLGNGGHRARFVPALAQVVAVAANTVTKATEAAASAATALNAPGTQATSATSFTLATGSKAFTLAQSGKVFPIGGFVSIARTSDATKVCYGTITAFADPTLTVNVTKADVAGGPFTDWTIGMSGPAGAGAVGKIARYIPADQITARLTNGPAAGTVALASGVLAKTLDFDPATIEYAQFSALMRKSWNEGTVSAKFIWSLLPNTAPATFDYAHAYGVGNRSASITVTTDFTLGAGAVANWVNGNTADNAAYISSGQAATGKYIKFVFAAAVSIDQIRWVCEATAPDLGTYTWEGSNNGADWTSLTTGIVLMSAGGTTTYNVTAGAYLQYRFVGTAGTTGIGRYMHEIEFRAGDPITPAGGVAWSVRGVALSDTEALSATFGSAITVTDSSAQAASAALITTESAAVTIGGTPAEGDYVVFEVYRDVGNAADTLAIDARLHGVTLYITTNAATDD